MQSTLKIINKKKINFQFKAAEDHETILMMEELLKQSTLIPNIVPGGRTGPENWSRMVHSILPLLIYCNEASFKAETSN